MAVSNVKFKYNSINISDLKNIHKSKPSLPLLLQTA